MNKLACDVSNCMYNEANLCCLQKIKVDGPSASVSSGTCCASFVEKGNAAHNSVGKCGCDASPDTNIDCKAENCTYNEHCKCHAKDVKVGCCCNSPKSMSETECCTFKCC